MALVAKLPITLAWGRFVVRHKFKVPAVRSIVSPEIKVRVGIGIRQQNAISVSVFGTGAHGLLIPPENMTLVAEPPVALPCHCFAPLISQEAMSNRLAGTPESIGDSV
jgi:hypothetical protein